MSFVKCIACTRQGGMRILMSMLAAIVFDTAIVVCICRVQACFDFVFLGYLVVRLKGRGTVRWRVKDWAVKLGPLFLVGLWGDVK